MYTHTNEPVSPVLLHLHAEGNKKIHKSGNINSLRWTKSNSSSYAELTGLVKWKKKKRLQQGETLHIFYIYMILFNKFW